MKRDMDLVRKVLIAVEDLPYTGVFHQLAVEGYSENEITYHVLLLAEAGLLEAFRDEELGGLTYLPIRLTWAGHEFLDATKDEKVWRKAKEAVGKAGGLVFDVLKPILIQLGIAAAQRYLALPPQP